MKKILLVAALIPVMASAQKTPDSSKLQLPQPVKEKIKSILPNVNQVINPSNNQHAYRVLPWVHRFLDTASAASINRFLRETTDSTLQLLQYESITARHSYFLENPYSPNDKDGDGVRSIESGGADCDDLNNNTFPGNNEQCEGYFIFTAYEKKYILINRYQDEDCDYATVAGPSPDGDEDHDKQICNTCINYSGRIPSGTDRVAVVPTLSAISLGNPNRNYTIRGYDCDDHNYSLIRASQICIDERTIAVCENGKWRYYPCQKCVTQPNGTGVVVE
jgi:hypothetical protein